MFILATPMNQPTAKDSKAKILQAFNQLLTEKKKSPSMVATKEEEAEKAKNQEILVTASAYTSDSIVKGLADLQLEFGSIINQLTDTLSAETRKLDELKRAREIENQRLQEFQQIRIVADALDILRKEHQENLKLVEQNATAQQEILDKDQVEKRKLWEREAADFVVSVQERRELINRDRQRQEADYNYELERLRTIETDEYEEARRTLERELQETNQIKEKDWTEREQILTKNQPLLEEYRQKIEAFPKQLDELAKRFRTEAIEDTNREAKVKAELFEKEWEGSKKGYELKIQSLEATIQRQTEQIADLSAQLQVVLKQAQDLAMKAFSSSSNGNGAN